MPKCTNNKCIDCGARIDHRAMRCHSCANQGQRNPMWGKKHSLETRHKLSEAKQGNKNALKNGRIIRGRGYVLLLRHEHPHAMSDGYVREHRLVMEEFLGRYLEPKEVVHHINNNRADNRLENLILFASDAEHLAWHREARQG